MTKLARLTALALVTLLASAAHAQAVRSERNISLDLANQIAAATVASCQAAGYAVTATVVDRSGGVRVGNDVIGAVGVGGAPGGHLDEQCAVAGLDKVKDLLK